MKKNSFKKNGLLFRTVVLTLSCFFVSVAMNFFGFFSYFENKTYDIRMRATSKYVHASDDIIFIGVDQNSIDWAKKTRGWNWPWPREAYAQIVEFLSAGNPKSIAFDILYTEPSVYGTQDDEIFALAEQKSGKVIQTVFVSENYKSPLVLFPISQIKENAAIIANITSLMDEDDIIRRTRIGFQHGKDFYPSLGFAPLYLEEQPNFSELPVQKDNSLLLRYTSSANDYLPYSAMEILKSYDDWKAGKTGTFVPEDFADFYIFVALYAPGLFDICSTPISQVYPGVGVHITALDNYLNNSFIKKVPDLICVFWIFLLCSVGVLACIFAEKVHSVAKSVFILTFVLIVAIFLAVGIPFILFAHGIWLILVAPLFSFVVSIIASTGVSFLIEGKQKRFIKTAFSQCLSKDVVNQIVSDPSSFTLGGKKYFMTAIFSDIKNFSSISELLSAVELGELLNFYLTEMSEIIIAEGGTIDKYEGDAIVAMFGAPLEMSDHASKACRAAIKMKKAECEMNKKIVQIAKSDCSSEMNVDLFNAFKKIVQAKKFFFTRIGINSGEMTAGYFGSKNKKNYTMMGNNVNLASRLEGVNKQYHTGGILISGQTFALLGEEFVLRSLDKVRVVNVNAPVDLYELLELKANASKKLLFYVERWELAIKNFKNENYAECERILKNLFSENPNDETTAYYLKLLQNYFLKGKFPSYSDSEGVVYDEKNRVFILQQK